MKKIIIFLAVMLYLNISAQTIPNAGFETWVTNTESPEHYLVPQNWITVDVINNSFNTSYTVASVARTTVSHSGTYAVLLQTAIGGGDTVGGGMFSCNSLANLFASSGITGFPYTARPSLFQGYYKLTTVGGDIVGMFTYLTKWNTTHNKRDTIAQSYFVSNGNESAYTQFSVPFAYTINEFPDTASISVEIASTTGNTTHIGTQFYLDDLGFSGSVPLGIEQYGESNTINMYPNPNNGSFVIEPNTNTKQTVMVYDVNSKLVLSQTINGKTSIDASSLNEGVYNISMNSSEGAKNKKLVIVK